MIASETGGPEVTSILGSKIRFMPAISMSHIGFRLIVGFFHDGKCESIQSIGHALMVA
jgi:hypothetical protein